MPNEEFISTDTVREKLIIAGITELEEHGMTDFSLRRVSAASNVSCAAPYKHFKNKEDFICAIVEYIYNQWLMLYSQIFTIFEGDKKKQLVELCVAYTRFCMGNSHFRSVIIMNTNTITSDKTDIKHHISQSITHMVKAYFTDKCVSEESQKHIAFRINALVQSTALVSDNSMYTSNEDAVNMLRECVEFELKI